MLKPFSILVVDDNPSTIESLRQAASNTFPQADFTSVFSFDQAVRYFEGLTGLGPRLVLLNTSLQSAENGFDFLARMRQHPQGRLLPIIVLSADQSGEEEAYLAGANAFTIKPEGLDGWTYYVQQVKSFWYEVATIPRLRFD